jgi:DNA-binding winged helix-turn-helix (wHTH) protein/tetratricopeptide (TPR) repeat protein
MLPLSNRLQFGEFLLDPDFRTLRRGDRPVALTGKAFDLLAYMAANPGRPLLKEELLKAVWPDSFVEESSLSQNVFVIRKALGPAGEGTIQTLPGRGYLFAVPVVQTCLPPALTRKAELTYEATETRMVFEESTEEHVPFWQSPVTLSFAVSALALLGIAGWLGWQRYEDRVGGPPVQVVVADLDGTTGDAVLDRTLSSVLKIEMAQSPFVNVVSGSRIRSAMALMMHKPDDPFTGEVAHDVCERTDSQAVLHMAVARAGSHYVITEDATNCADGNTMATATQDVARVEDLPQAIMKNGASIRHSLGESRRMIARFNQPLLPAATGSIEALKDYSQAAYLGQHGRFLESRELLKQAVSIDPKFAAAYNDMAVMSANMADIGSLRTYIQKAYELREYATEPTKLFITAFYHQEITGDLDEAIRNYKTWIDIYPKQPQPWAGVGEAYRQMGYASEGVEVQQHLLQMIPTYTVPYYGLAEAQMRTGDYEASLATCRLAISRHLDGESLHLTLLRLGHLRHDADLIADQDAWLKQHPDSPLILINQANFAQVDGRMRDAEALFDKAWDVYRRQGTPDAATRFKMGMADGWWDLSEPELARKYLSAAPIQNEFEDLLALAELGAPDKAQAMLRDYLAAHPQSTLWNRRYAPLLRGEFALLAHKPQEAIALMEPSRQFDGTSLDGYYLRGMAYMQANQLPQAEAEFRNLLAHPYIEPTAAGLPLAKLQLARVLAREGNKSGADVAYRGFLDAWKNADPGQPLVLAARKGLEALAHLD